MAKIYVGTYAKYNSGSIAGNWLDCEDYSDYEEFIDACKELHKDESDPELMFQDYEEFPKDFYSESSINPQLWAWLNMADHEQEIVTAYLSQEALPDDISDILEWYTGTYSDWAEYAEEITTDCSEIPDHLQYYIDWEKMGRDMSINCAGTHVEYEGQLFLFENY